MFGDFAETFDNINQLGLLINRNFNHEFKKEEAHTLKVIDIVKKSGMQYFFLTKFYIQKT